MFCKAFYLTNFVFCRDRENIWGKVFITLFVSELMEGPLNCGTLWYSNILLMIISNLIAAINTAIVQK